jgi:L-rhamnose mutarotase
LTRALRVGQVLGLRAGRLDEYRRLHAAVWPEIAAAIRDAGLENYSIFHFGGRLFSYFEFDGTRQELDARMAELAAAPRMREWWDLMEPMQEPLEGRKPGEWWAAMEEVFHLD